MLIDAHFHLDLMENMQILISELKSADIGVMAVGTTPKAYEREKQFCYNIENIRVGLGLHPQLVAERGSEIDLFLRLARNSKYVGEVGLDFNSGYSFSQKQQVDIFRKIAAICADEGGKVLSIHSLKAAGTVIDELEKAGTFRRNICIFHWFTGTITECRRAMDAGAWFSINPRMIKTKGGKEIIKILPADKILLETDAPFTHKYRNLLELKYDLNRLVNDISEIRGEDIREAIEQNSERVLDDKY